MPKVTFVNEHRIVEVAKGRNLRDVALECGIDLHVEDFDGINCGGRGLCSSCMCWVEEGTPGAAGKRSFLEKLRALRGWRRLACKASVLGDVKVFSMAGGDERVRKQRPISPPPRPTKDPGAARKPIDAASTTQFPLGHPAEIASGTRTPPERVTTTGTATEEETDDADKPEGDEPAP